MFVSVMKRERLTSLICSTHSDGPSHVSTPRALTSPPGHECFLDISSRPYLRETMAGSWRLLFGADTAAQQPLGRKLQERNLQRRAKSLMFLVFFAKMRLFPFQPGGGITRGRCVGMPIFGNLLDYVYQLQFKAQSIICDGLQSEVISALSGGGVLWFRCRCSRL